MATVAHEVMVEAERVFRFAPALAEAMEPHLLARISDSRIYGYTNERKDQNVPPSDVMLAAALAAGISIDQKLGLAARSADDPVEGMRAELLEMREQIADLQRRLNVPGGPAPTRQTETSDEITTAKAERAARRKAWAQRSQTDGAARRPEVPGRQVGRTPRP
jgi:hypothetical protein